jgi:hypothetical protein
MAAPVEFRYRAFISYKHADTKWANWLHGRLEGFRIDSDLIGRETPMGLIPKTLRPIFRDRDDFTAGHSLSEQTRPVSRPLMRSRRNSGQRREQPSRRRQGAIGARDQDGAGRRMDGGAGE